MRLSRATRLRHGDAARFVFVHSASELKLIGTFVPNLVHGSTPTVDRNGWSAMNSLENAWSPLVLMLKAVPMSANAARLTASPMIGIRYSKFPSNCVSPPIDVKDRSSIATFAPVGPVNVPSAAAAAGGSSGITVGLPEALEAKTTFRDVINESTGAIGLIERTL